MSKKNILDRSIWSNDEQLQGLLFFAEKFCELTSLTTIDSFRAPALNLRLCLREVAALSNLVNDGTLKRERIDPLIQELRSKISNDPVLPQSSQGLFEKYGQTISTGSPTEIGAAARAFQLELNDFYWNRLLTLVASEVKNPRNHSKISSLASALVLEAECRGFSRTHLFRLGTDYFFSATSPLKKIERCDQIEFFLKEFEAPPEKWLVVFRGDAAFNRVPIIPKKITIATDIAPFINADEQAPPDLSRPDIENPTFILIHDLKSLDPRGAREEGNEVLSFFSHVYSFHHVSPVPTWNPVGFVRRERDRVWFTLKPIPISVSSAHSWFFKKMPIENTIEAVLGLHLNPNSTVRLQNALSFHMAAQAIESSEHKLLTLWSLLEGLLPGHPAKDAMNLIIPSLRLSYSEKIVRFLAARLLEGPKAAIDLVKSIPADKTFFGKTAALLSCDEYAEQAKDLCAALANFPLIRNHFYNFRLKFMNGRGLKQLLDDHEQRVLWHLARIYIARNQIAHRAQAHGDTKILAEHLHHYVDVLLFSLVELAIVSRGEASIATLITQLRIHSENYSNFLKSNETARIDNFRAIIFGSENPLSPFKRKSHLRKQFIIPFAEEQETADDKTSGGK